MHQTNSDDGDEVDRSVQVVADRCRIQYRRLGSGRPVILLRPPELAASVDAALLHGLAEHFRVLVPCGEEPMGPVADVPGPGSTDEAEETIHWLTCFVEGIGVMGGAVVAAGRYREAAARIAADLPDQLSSVVLVHAEGADDHGASAHALVVAADGDLTGEALRRIVSFLLPEPDPQSP